jgi:Xaa-Pro aminopeptidase
LSVHEGPARISKTGGIRLETGMILSNEPGYYKAGAYGIRIENLAVVTEAAPIGDGERPMHGFETLTLAPIDRRLIDASLLTDAERGWLNAYHARVRGALAPKLPGDDLAWLEAATRPL